LLSAAFATLLGAAVIAGCSAGAARADDDTDGEEPTLLDTQILQYVLKGLGWRRGDQEKGIEYRERSPLVLPNSKDLPPPEKTQPAKSKVAGWPDDPDVKRAKKKKDDERKRKSYTEGVDDRPLLPSQVAKGADKIDPPQTILGSKNEEEATRPSSVWELGSKNIFSKVWGNNDDYTTFTGEPRRESLIEPPSGYRTPSPNQPFGVGKDRWVAPKVDRQEPVR
jgi:hypothetical protein